MWGGVRGVREESGTKLQQGVRLDQTGTERNQARRTGDTTRDGNMMIGHHSVPTVDQRLMVSIVETAAAKHKTNTYIVSERPNPNQTPFRSNWTKE